MSFQATIRANIAEVRSKAADFLIDTCNIRRKESETVVDGQNVVTYATGIATICRLIVRSGSESTNIAAQERLTAQSQFTGLYRMQLPFGTEIEVDDHIEYTDIETGKVFTFSVVFVPPHNDMTGAFVIGLKEVV